MRTYHVIYAGPFLSGRSTSLRLLCQPRDGESWGAPNYLRYPLARDLERGAEITTASGAARVQIALVYWGNHWFPTISAARASDLHPQYLDHIERLVAFMPVLDGVVFIADSQPERTEANLETLEMLLEFMREQGIDPAHVPFVFQLNKRDIPDVLGVEELRTILATPCCAHVESIAVQQRGVHEALETLLRLADDPHSRP